MVVELIIGVLLGILTKQIIKYDARKSSVTQIFSAEEYSSIRYGNNLPKNYFFNLFNLKPNLVIVHYQEEQVIKEDFYTAIGDRTTAIYQNGIFVKCFWELWGLPVYLCTTIIPLLLGFISAIFLSFIPLINSYTIPLFINEHRFKIVLNLK